MGRSTERYSLGDWQFWNYVPAQIDGAGLLDHLLFSKMIQGDSFHPLALLLQLIDHVSREGTFRVEHIWRFPICGARIVRRKVCQYLAHGTDSAQFIINKFSVFPRRLLHWAPFRNGPELQ